MNKLIVNFEHFFNNENSLQIVKFYSSIQDFAPDFRTIVSVGTFDGVHMGHRVILNRMNEIAKKVGGESVLLSFSPHPRYVLYPEDQHMRLINTTQEKIALLRRTGLVNLVVHEFTKKFSRIKSVNFVRDVLVEQMQVNTLVVGYNHHFGRNREGSFEELSSLADLYGFKIEMIDPQLFEAISVSSTKIRHLLEEGDIQKANQYLGYDFLIKGTVIHGNALGKSIGFPTANIDIEDKRKLIPANGVYAVKVNVEGEKYHGMMNIGLKPTLGSISKTIEVNIFDFNKEIYGKEIEVSFVQRIREERQFKDLEFLREQLTIDKNRIKQILF